MVTPFVIIGVLALCLTVCLWADRRLDRYEQRLRSREDHPAGSQLNVVGGFCMTCQMNVEDADIHFRLAHFPRARALEDSDSWWR